MLVEGGIPNLIWTADFSMGTPGYEKQTLIADLHGGVRVVVGLVGWSRVEQGAAGWGGVGGWG